jgi:hypothetical protein
VRRHTKALLALLLGGGCASAVPAPTSSDGVAEHRVLVQEPKGDARCASQLAPTIELLSPPELASAFTPVRAKVHRCMALHGVTKHVYVNVEVHGPTGRIAAASTEQAPPSATLDACVAQALSTWCVDPFVAPQATQPFLLLRLPFVSAPEWWHRWVIAWNENKVHHPRLAGCSLRFHRPPPCAQLR